MLYDKEALFIMIDVKIVQSLDSDDMDDNPDGVRALKDALEILQLYREMI